MASALRPEWLRRKLSTVRAEDFESLAGKNVYKIKGQCLVCGWPFHVLVTSFAPSLHVLCCTCYSIGLESCQDTTDGPSRDEDTMDGASMGKDTIDGASNGEDTTDGAGRCIRQWFSHRKRTWSSPFLCRRRVSQSQEPQEDKELSKKEMVQLVRARLFDPMSVPPTFRKSKGEGEWWLVRQTAWNSDVIHWPLFLGWLNRGALLYSFCLGISISVTSMKTTLVCNSCWSMHAGRSTAYTYCWIGGLFLTSNDVGLQRSRCCYAMIEQKGQTCAVEINYSYFSIGLKKRTTSAVWRFNST